MTTSVAASLQPPHQPATQDRPTIQLRRRDRYIDSLRAVALIRVMTYHVFGWAWLPILFPSLGIMFALAGSLIASSLDRSPGNPWRVLKKRGIRLLPPLWLFGLVVVPTMLVAGWTYNETAGAPLNWRTLLFWVVPISDPPGSELGQDWVTPLWYIRAYLWFLLLSPATLWLFRHWPRRMMAIPVIVVLMSAFGLIPLSGRDGDVILSIAMFGGCWMLGFAHHDNMIRPMPLGGVLLGGVSLMALGLTWAFTHPDPFTTYDIDNIPMANTLYCLGAVLILLRLYPDFSWMDRHVILDKLVTVISSRAMTIYLWGNVAIFLSSPLLALWTVTGSLNQDNAMGYALIYVTSWLVLIVFVFAFGWCEDLAARRPLRFNPWPRSEHQLETMRTRKVLTFPHPRWMPDLTPKRLFIITWCLLAAATAASAAALVGTNTPSRTSTADAPPRYAVNPRPITKPPANLGQGNRQNVTNSRPAPSVPLTQDARVLPPVDRAPTVPSPLLNVPSPLLNVPSPLLNVPNPLLNVPNPLFNVPNPLFNVPNPLLNVPNPLFNIPNPLFNIPTPGPTLPGSPTPGPTVPTPVPTVPTPDPTIPTVPTPVPTVPTPEPTVPTPVPTVPTPEPTVPTPVPTVPTPEPTVPTPEPTVPTPDPTVPTPDPTVPTPDPTVPTPEPTVPTPEPTVPTPDPTVPTPEPPPTTALP